MLFDTVNTYAMYVRTWYENKNKNRASQNKRHDASQTFKAGMQASHTKSTTTTPPVWIESHKKKGVTYWCESMRKKGRDILYTQDDMVGSKEMTDVLTYIALRQNCTTPQQLFESSPNSRPSPPPRSSKKPLQRKTTGMQLKQSGPCSLKK